MLTWTVRDQQSEMDQEDRHSRQLMAWILASRRCLIKWVTWLVPVAVGAAFCTGFALPKSCVAQSVNDPSRVDLLAPYVERLESLDAEREWTERSNEMPPDYEPWWRPKVEQPLRSDSQALTVHVESLVLGALHHSPRIRVLTDIPLIRRTDIAQAEAAFDVSSFVQSKFINTNDPVGSTLTTGGPNRFLDQNSQLGGGFRQRTLIGGQWELAQSFGLEQSNSIYFVPPDQGTARMSLSYTQPLLNGAGRNYNQSIVVLANIEASAAMDEFLAQLQSHLFDVTRAYWELYLERAALLQKQRLYGQAASIVSELEARRAWDASETQLLRARAEVARRRADLNLAGHAVRNAEARIIALVNDPLLLRQHAELIPVQVPYISFDALTLRDSALLAVQNRPEVDRAMKEIHAASIRAGVATQDLLPALNLVVAGYVSGLQGNDQIGAAFADQFSVGAPSYSAGLQFEMPYGNRAARARQEKYLLEVRRFSHQLQVTVAALLSDVEKAVREVHTAGSDVQARYHAMFASAMEIDRLTERWRLLPGEGGEAGFVLENLLNAQVRLGEEEYGFLFALVNNNLAQSNLRRATGTLLQYQQVELVEGSEDGLPVIHTTRVPHGAVPTQPEYLDSIGTPSRISSQRNSNQVPRLR